MNPPVSVHEREVAVVEYLRTAPDGARTIRDVWVTLSRPEPEGIGDRASLSTYHRTIAKLVRRGQVEEDTQSPNGAARFRVAELLSPLNTFTLDDLETALWELSAPEALAAYLDAVDYYEANADKVLAKAAEGLVKENPVDLILEMLQDEVAHLKEDIADLRDSDAAEPEHRRRTALRLQALSRFVYGELGLGAKRWDIPTLDQLVEGDPIEPGSWETVRDTLMGHVFGDFFIEKVQVAADDLDRSGMIVAGSDGSAHAGYPRGVPAPQYVEEEGRLIMTFNNSIAYVDLPPTHPQRIDFPYHGVPMTRAALEDPHNRGMIIARPWFPDLTDSEFEHMKKAALDVVQFRVDERLVKGAARAYGTKPAGGGSGLLPKPHVLLRDGTVTPQEREFQHYTDPTTYGDVVREGIALSHSILKAVADSDRRVYGGAVKSTQLHTFSRVINWYIKRGSRHRFDGPIDAGWDIARASQVTDSVAVTRLLRTLPSPPRGAYYRTCIIVRPFPAMVTSLRRVRAETAEEWLDVFERWRRHQIEEWRRRGGEQPWLAGVELEDDPYVRMTQEADYGMFYFGVPGGDPQITFPRFEFMDALRKLDQEETRKRVFRTVEMIMTGVHLTKWHLDKDHSFMTMRKLPRLVPYVVYEAHEKCKVLGHKLEAELRQAIAARLSQLKALRGLPAPKVDIEPVSLRSYFSKVKDKLLGTGEDQSDEQAGKGVGEEGRTD